MGEGCQITLFLYLIFEFGDPKISDNSFLVILQCMKMKKTWGRHQWKQYVISEKTSHIVPFLILFFYL